MGFKLMNEVDYSETDSVPFENWQSEFDFWSRVAKLEEEVKEGNCSEEPMFDDINGYCEFFGQDCSRCSLSKYQVGLEGEDDRVIGEVCDEYGGIVWGCLMEQDHESLPSAISVGLEAIKKDGIRWGYYTPKE